MFKSSRAFAAGSLLLLMSVSIFHANFAEAATLTLPVPPFTAGSAISSNDINSNFSFLATRMPAVKQTYNGGGAFISLSSASPNVMSTAVTCPAAGTLLATASGSIYNPAAANSDQLFRVKVSTSATDVNEGDGALIFIRYMTGASAAYQTPFTSSKAISCNAGQYVTFYLNIWHQLGGTGTSKTDDTTLTVMYFPTTL